MALNTTVLQFGYLLAWLFAIVLITRGIKEERLSDKMLSFVMFLLAQELQDYTFGFAGINILWEKFNGFPRYTGLLLGPITYFYLKTQINQQFSFEKSDAIHLVPWGIYFLLNLAIFFQGKFFVQQFQESSFGVVLVWIEHIAIVMSYLYYFYLSLKIYYEYKRWIETQFSDIESVSLDWFRNFIYIMIGGQAFRWSFLLLDSILKLNFMQEWWWNLGIVFVVCYVGIMGFAQNQSKRTVFKGIEDKSRKKFEISEDEIKYWKGKLLHKMEEDKIYLNPELNLNSLAVMLRTNSLLLSFLINNHFGKNFNDFINEYRINEFKKRIQNPNNQYLTMFGIALDSGFNSKATFNRAFKKITGKSPKDFNRIYENLE
jgi:AraC-like DNA-binding protein